QYFTYDLAEEWLRFTRKPFVFAFWAVRKDALHDLPAGFDLAGVFQRSRDHGLTQESLNKIAEEWAPRLRISEASVRTYLTENIHYYLESDCIDGLQLFYRYAQECGALPTVPPLDFLKVDKP